MKKKILIVDDDEGVRETLRILLEDSEYELVFACFGEECIAQLEEGFKGLILLDIMMPGMDGWATLEKMVELGLMQGNAVCMLTAVADPGSRGETLTSYVLEYLRKPFSEEELLAVLEQYSEMIGT